VTIVPRILREETKGQDTMKTILILLFSQSLFAQSGERFRFFCSLKDASGSLTRGVEFAVPSDQLTSSPLVGQVSIFDYDQQTQKWVTLFQSSNAKAVFEMKWLVGEGRRLGWVTKANLDLGRTGQVIAEVKDIQSGDAVLESQVFGFSTNGAAKARCNTIYETPRPGMSGSN
jgi:hypothetical protein